MKSLHALNDSLNRDANLGCELRLRLEVMGNELVQRGVEQANRNRSLTHDLEDANEVTFLQRFNKCKGLLTTSSIGGKNHLAHGVDALTLEEHVLCAAETNTICSKVEGRLGILGDVSIGTHAKALKILAPRENRAELTLERGLTKRDLALEHQPAGSVDRNPVTLLEQLTVQRKFFALEDNITAARNTRLPHTTSDNRGVRRHTSTGSKNTCCGVHATEVLRRGLQAHHDHLLSCGVPRLRVGCGEHHLAHSGTGAGCETLGDVLELGAGIDLRVHEVVNLVGIEAHDSLLLGNETFLHHVDCALHGSEGSALGVTALQHPEAAVLDGELNVLHVAEVLLQRGTNIAQLAVALRHCLLHRGEPAEAVSLGDVVLLRPLLRESLADLLRCADTSDDVLTLGVDQELTEKEILTI
mmetsp:Transcript_33123/g.38543  ORF Transcript_33123/g.38543 Transcript_33123/m.38543 type:complete len:414 (+) Transcript_33123:1074-2315(+)